MKKIIIACYLLFITLISYAQTPTVGDYRSAVITGNWSTLSTWQVRDASGNWSTPTSLPTLSNNVYIQKNHTITVDVAAASCYDLHLNISGALNIGSNILSVNGKIRADSMATASIAIVGATDATFYTDNANYTTLNATMVTSTTTGGLKFVGATRTLNLATEWNSNGTGNVSVIFALDANAIGTINAGFKAKTFIFQSGIVSAASGAFMSAGAVGTGTVFLIKSGAKFTTARSGATNSAIGFSSSKKCDNITIENGGILEFNASTPTVDCASITNNGTVIYLAGAGPLAAPTANGVTDGAVNITSYKNLVLGGSGAKSIPTGQSITVSDTLKLEGTNACVLASVGGSTLTYGANATLVFNITTGTSTLVAGSIEWPLVNGPKNIEFRRNTVQFTASTANNSRTVAGTLYFTGGTFNVSTGDTLILANNSSLIRRTNVGGLTVSGVYLIGSVSTDLTTIIIDTTGSITETKELQYALASAGKPNLTITSGTTYTAGARSIYTLNNSGIFVMSATGFTINGDIAGNGTISGNVAYSLTIQGALSGPTTSTLNFTTGYANLYDFTINRTGTNASIVMGTNLTVARDLFLTAGVLNDNGKTINVSRNISYNSGAIGTGTHISGSGGKIVMLANTATTANYIGATSLGNVEINYTNLTKSLRAGASFSAENFSFAQSNIKFNLLGYNVTIKKDLTGIGVDSFINTTGTGWGGLTNSHLIMSGASNIISGITVMDTLEIASGASITASNSFALKKLILNGTMNDGGNVISNTGDIVGAGLHIGNGRILMQGSLRSIIGGTRINNIEIASGASISATPPAVGCSAFISGLLTMNGGNIGIDTGNTLTMKNGSRIFRTSGNLNLNGGVMAMGESATDTIAVTINATLQSSNELPGNPTGIIDLTINDGFDYTLRSNNKLVRNLNLNSGQLTTDPADLPIVYGITSTGTTKLSGNYILYAGLNIKGVLKFDDNVSNKTLNANSFLTFKSTSSVTGSLAPVLNGNNIIGDAVVERYLQNKKAWRLLYMPTQHTTQNIHDSWQEGGANNDNPNPGYGIQITSNDANWQGNGFDTLSRAPSVKYFEPSTSEWVGIPSTSIPFENGQAYMAFVRGNRSVTGFGQSSTSTVLREQGALNIGDVNWSNLGTAGNQFVAIGNPYPSAISLSNITTANLDPSFYVWDPLLAGTNGFGAYQTMSVVGGNVVITPSAGGSYSSGNKNIESGQGFFVHTNGGSGTITFHENDKANGSNLVSKVPSLLPSIRLNLFKNSNNEFALMDGVLNIFDSSFSNDVNNADAVKLFNPSENLSIKQSNQNLAIEARNLLHDNDTIHYAVSQMKLGSYTFEITPERLDNFGLTGYLIDNYLQVSTPVSLSNVTSVFFDVTNDTSSYSANRFHLVFKYLRTTPVKFINVKAIEQEHNIFVSWNVENEINIRNYVIEKSIDGINFFESGAQLVNQSSSYNWIDNAPNENKNFYRIKSIGNTGEILYSKIVNVNFINHVNEPQFTVSPNPINQSKEVTLNFTDLSEGDYDLGLYDFSGKKIYSKSFFHQQNEKIFKFKLTVSVSPGYYNLILFNKDQFKLSNKIYIE